MIGKIKNAVGGAGGIGLLMIMLVSVVAVPVSAGGSSYTTVEVVDGSGNPIEGVSVDLMSGGEVVDTKEVGESGAVMFDGLDSGDTSYQVVASKYGRETTDAFVSTDTNGDFQDVSLTMYHASQQNVEISAYDEETNANITGASVVLTHDGEEYFEGETGTSGMVALGAIPGEYEVTVDHQNYTKETATINVEQGTTERVFYLAEGSDVFAFGGGSGVGGMGSDVAMIGGGIVLIVAFLGSLVVALRD